MRRDDITGCARCGALVASLLMALSCGEAALPSAAEELPATSRRAPEERVEAPVERAEELEARREERAIEAGAILTSIERFGARDAPSARLVFTFDREIELTREDHPGDAALPAREVLVLPGVQRAEDVESVITVDAGGVARARLSMDDEALRITFDMSEGAEPLAIYSLREPFRIVVDAHRDRALASSELLIVLDPGHGGDDFGARAFGLRESELALDLALRVRSSILALRPDARVVLTREDDTFVSLEQRAAIANAIGASMFVSLHFNAADEPVDHGGITTFVLDTTGDRSALRLAARENGTSTAEVTELSRILARLHRAANDRISFQNRDFPALQRQMRRAGQAVVAGTHEDGVEFAHAPIPFL